MTDIGRVDLADMQVRILAEVRGAVLDVGWSPDGNALAYLVDSSQEGIGSGSATQLWIAAGSGQPRAVTPLIPVFGRDGSLSDETTVRFSPDGRYVLMVDTFSSGGAPASPDFAIVQVRSVSDGSLVWTPPSALATSGSKFDPFVTMAVWAHSGDRLYYRDQAGVHSWDPAGGLKTLSAGLAWYWPSVSPDDRLVAYMLEPAGKAPATEILDVNSGSKRQLSGSVGNPIFVTAHTLLESHFAVNPEGWPPHIPAGLYELDLNSNSELTLPWHAVVDAISL